MNSPHVPTSSFFMNKINRLRDVLVPIESFVDMLNYMEGTNIGMEFHTSNGKTPNLWICPYPYQVPAKNYIKMQGSSIEDLLNFQRAQYTIINDRIGYLKDNAITEEEMDRLDNNPDIGVIVHMVNGRIIPFTYSCTSDLQILNIKNTFPDLVNSIKEDTFEDLSKTMGYIKQFTNDDKYRMIYCFNYIKEDPFNTKGIPIMSGNNTSAMELDINLDIASFIIDQYKKHEKVICVA